MMETKRLEISEEKCGKHKDMTAAYRRDNRLTYPEREVIRIKLRERKNGWEKKINVSDRKAMKDERLVFFTEGKKKEHNM